MGQGGCHRYRKAENSNLIIRKIMGGGYLFGWDPDAEGWVKVACNPAGELDIDATAIFENPPTEDEAAKGPSSEWAFDHNANASAHHSKYTDVNSRAAIGNVLTSTGKVATSFNVNYGMVFNCGTFELKASAIAEYKVQFLSNAGYPIVYVRGYQTGVGYVATEWHIFDGTVYVKVIDENSFQTNLALYLENVPTEEQATKAPTSKWAFAHNANSAAHHTPPTAGDFNHQDLANRGANDHHTPPTAGSFNHQDLANRGVDDHHAKFTAAEARAAINNIFGSDGKADAQIDMDYNSIIKAEFIQLRFNAADTKPVAFRKFDNTDVCFIYIYEDGVGFVSTRLMILFDGDYREVITSYTFQTNLALFLEENPTNGVVNKAPTSNWAYDHNANASAHHTKYTDANAQAACGLSGNLYHSISGVAFKPHSPILISHAYLVSGSLIIWANGVNVYCPVELPHGVTVTAVKVDGNAGASSEQWAMYRVALSDQTRVLMSWSTVQTESEVISYETINNELYTYFITVTSLNINDEIHSARIRFTL